MYFTLTFKFKFVFHKYRIIVALGCWNFYQFSVPQKAVNVYPIFNTFH